MKDIPFVADDVAIVSQNSFEELCCKIEKERQTARNSELNIERQRDILKTISSVYFFLRNTLGMPYRAISLEEFKIAEARLRQIAEEEIKKFWPRFWDALGRQTFWHYYLKFAYFPSYSKRTVIGNWNDHFYRLRGGYGIEKILEDKDSSKIPPNVEEIMNEIFAKKYGSPA